MDTSVERETGPLTFGVEIEVFLPVLKAPENKSIEKPLEFPANDWYEKNCVFYTKEDGRKIPVVKDDVQVSKEARQAIWNELLELFKETMEKPDCRGAKPDLRVMTAETEHPRQTFNPGHKEQQANASAADKKLDLDPNVLGKFVDGHYEVYDSWTVCQDGSGSWYPGVDGDLFQPSKVPPIGPRGYSWFSIEIKSKVYKDLDLFERDLKKVCDRIRSRFLVSINCGRKYNRSSTHVHVGRSGKWDPNDEDLPFNLLEAKKMATAMYMLEPALMTLHAPWKRHYHRYAAGLRGYTYLEGFCEQERTPEVDWKTEFVGLGPFDPKPGLGDKAYTRNNFRLDDHQQQLMESFSPIAKSPYPAAMGMIWGADDMTKLAWLLSCREGARRGIFALHGLVRTKEGVIGSRNLNTVEFRHMHGSLDVQDIMNWVRIIEKVVSSSITESDRSYEEFLRLISGDAKGIAGILKGMGLKLSIKSAEQVAAETSPPQILVGREEREDIWRRKGSLMFLSKPDGS